MKRTTRILLRGLLLVFLLSSISIVLSTVGVKTTNAAYASISVEEAHAYLEKHGYEVYELKEAEDTGNWVAHTSKDGIEYITTIKVVNTQIIDHEDMPL